MRHLKTQKLPLLALALATTFLANAGAAFAGDTLAQVDQDLTPPDEPMPSGPPPQVRPPAISPSGGLRVETEIPPKNEFYLVPEFGMEFGAISRGVFAGATAVVQSVGYATGVASLALGGRWDVINLGVRYQGSYAGQNNLNDMQFHKVYGELGFNWRREIFVANLFFDFGYSALVSDLVFMNGLGGKAGVAFDFYLAKWFSLGPVASFDVQGFDTGNANVWVNTLGASIFGRIGFHI